MTRGTIRLTRMCRHYHTSFEEARRCEQGTATRWERWWWWWRDLWQ